MQAEQIISSKELFNKTQEDSALVVLDTRDPEEFVKGHIPGAVNLRDFFTYLATTDENGYKEFRDHFAGLLGAAGVDENSHVVIYEDQLNNGFGQSCRGWLVLQALGHTNAQVLDGGFSAWKEAGFPVSTEAVQPQAKTFSAVENAISDVFVDKDEMHRALHDHDVRILDIRDQDEWEGLSSSPYGVDFAPRKGRLEGAVWLQWDKLMDENEYLTKEQIVSTMRQLGIKTNHTVYIYCFKGARAANTYLALKMSGFSDVRVYFGSWNEWSRDPAMPVESDVLEVPACLA